MYYNLAKTLWVFLISIYSNIQIETNFLRLNCYMILSVEKMRKIGLEIVLLWKKTLTSYKCSFACTFIVSLQVF